MMLVLFGVSGVGKTTIGKLVAERLGWKFFDADDFHPPENIEKMRAGTALTDEDRRAWLGRLRKLIEEEESDGVLACSALKRKYRDALRVDDRVRFVFLRGDPNQIAARLAQRRDHFMNPELLASQFADLEEPGEAEGVIVVEVGRHPLEIVDEILAAPGRGG